MLTLDKIDKMHYNIERIRHFLYVAYDSDDDVANIAANDAIMYLQCLEDIVNHLEVDHE